VYELLLWPIPQPVDGSSVLYTETTYEVLRVLTCACVCFVLQTETKQMCIKQLRKEVVGKALEHHEEAHGEAPPKKALKTVFKRIVSGACVGVCPSVCDAWVCLQASGPGCLSCLCMHVVCLVWLPVAGAFHRDVCCGRWGREV
jgi:hypothetical protein